MAVLFGLAHLKVLKVVQINLHHCGAAAHNLRTTLRRLEIDIALVQELWILSGRVSTSTIQVIR